MIDFSRLDKLMQTARDPAAGKPLGNVRSFSAENWRGAYMRNSRMFQVGDGYRVELHGNTIAKLQRKPGDYALVTISNVERWATMTTRERLHSILGCQVWMHDRALRANFNNCSHQKHGRSFRTYPPLVSGQQFMVGPDGVWCVNTEIVMSTRQVVDRVAAKPILAYLQQIKKFGVPLCKLGGLQWKAVKENKQTSLAALDHLRQMPEASYDTVLTLLTAYYRDTRYYNLESEVSAESFDNAMRYVKDVLYKHHGAYVQEPVSWSESFSEVPSHVRAHL